MIFCILKNSDVRQMYINAHTEWLNHIKVCLFVCLSLYCVLDNGDVDDDDVGNDSDDSDDSDGSHETSGSL